MESEMLMGNYFSFWINIFIYHAQIVTKTQYNVMKMKDEGSTTHSEF